MAPDVLHHLTNDHLDVTVYGDASAVLTDRATGRRHRMGPVALQEDGPFDVGHVWQRTDRSICEQYPGRFRGRPLGDARSASAAVRFTLLGRLGREEGEFTAHYALDGPWLSVRVSDVADTLPSLVFPPPLDAHSLLLPQGVGRWIREPQHTRSFHRFFCGLNMRWFGGLGADEDEGWICVVDDGHEDAGVLTTQLASSPVWLTSLGTWEGTRSVRYRLTSGGYVGAALAFRDWAKDHGLHRSLEEKAEATPALRNLFGGRLLNIRMATPIRPHIFTDDLLPLPEGVDPATPPGTPEVFHTYADAERAVRAALELGMRRGLANVRGWIPGGYDESHPDVWPPEEKLGGPGELAALCALPDPVTVALHDNYQDIYEQSPSWPKGVLRLANGDPMPGGLWAGGQAYILDPRDGLTYARRNWEHLATLTPRAMFVDTTTAVNLYESPYGPDPLTRRADQAAKEELYTFFKEQGVVLGGEEAADFGVPWTDWLENRHRRVPGESVPLWPLVFHDAVLGTRYTEPLGVEWGDPEGGAPSWLTDVLWGYMLHFQAGHRPEPSWPAGFADTLCADEWHGRIATAAMTGHRYLTEDHRVERTEFSGGEAVTVNFSAEPVTVDGRSVPAYGYVTD